MRKVLIGVAVIVAVSVGAFAFTQRGSDGLDDERVLVLPERSMTVREARTTMRAILLDGGGAATCAATAKYSDREVFDIIAEIQAQEGAPWRTPTSNDDVATFGRIFKQECQRLFP